MNLNLWRALLGAASAALAGGLIGCEAIEEIKDQVEESVGTCLDPCSKVNDCKSTAQPPAPSVPGVDLPDLGDDPVVSCATNCGNADNRALAGYSECQLKCIVDSNCDNINDCWNTKSERYADACLGGRELPPVETAPKEVPPEPAPEAPPEEVEAYEEAVEAAAEAEAPSNGTATGSAAADELVQDPAVQAAVEAGGDGDNPFVVNYGSTPPNIVGEFKVDGTIDDAMNARPPGSAINTSICFQGLQDDGAGGHVITYCEQNVPGISTQPITGSGTDFTMYFVFPGAATVLFSGKGENPNDAGNVTSVPNAEALVVYASGVDVWEHSFTSWSLVGETCSFECSP